LKLPGLIVAVVFAALTFGLWAYLNQPIDEPSWPSGGVQGVAFSPFHAGQDPRDRKLPSRDEIDADLRLLASARVRAVRTYSSLDSLGEIPDLAARHKMLVSVGAWLDRARPTNQAEITAAVRLANSHSNVIRVFVGNESVLRGDLTVAELSVELDRVRAAVTQPVSTAEPWHVWVDNPELAEHVDFLGVHLLPYWEGIEVEQSIDFLVSRMEILQRTFPDKPIVIAEAGWPSQGRTRGAANASTSNEALFLRRFLQRAQQERYVYYLMEAFDQPWKARYEGAVGAYWGIYDVERRPKFAFVEPIVRIRAWQTLAGISVAIAALLLGMFYVNSSTLGTRGRSLLAIVVYAVSAAAVWMIHDYSQRYLTFTSVLIGTLMILGTLGVIAVLIAEAHEWAEARWATSRRRVLDAQPQSANLPKVSIHVPAHNEPPGMVIATLEALARLDYPDFEVLVIDNNTKDASTWQPVADRCRRLGPRFRFFHAESLPGFKAGALNYALARTAADAKIVAIIDSDYQVEPSWLRDLVPAFEREQVAIVQAPQDYRDDARNAFKAMCYAEYRGFFAIGMVTRNERNAIIQHGTMTLVRRDALDRVGGWAEWSITEDAELGLRLFEHGFEAHYVRRSYGKGVVPDTFLDYKRQRFRWAYGAMQILREHARALFLPHDGRLTRGQRYHFIAGWLPWLADGLNLIFNLAALSWSIAMIIAPYKVDPPLIMFSIVPLTLFTFKLVKLADLYITRIGANVRQTLAAAIAGWSLSHTIGLAVIKSAFTRNEPFRRTPKDTPPQRAGLRIVASASAEIIFLIALLACAYLITHQVRISPSFVLGLPEELKGPDVSVWVTVLFIQAMPYAAAVLVSIVSALRPPAKWLGVKDEPADSDVARRRA
jgi:exo-beta-1,3-glucanase (GH17 family)/cellulose synthase/poly-beta-1,6-N-acetylglucosamine synthase-like glycosyltransferase